MTQSHEPEVGTTCCSYQLHAAELIHQRHVPAHDLVQGVVEFAQLFQGLFLGFLVLLILQILSSQHKHRHRQGMGSL